MAAVVGVAAAQVPATPIQSILTRVAADFLRALIKAVPYKIHTILTDNGIQFANRLGDKYAFQLLFDRICLQHGIDHRLTKPKHPWTNGQVERLNRTLKDATV